MSDTTDIPTVKHAEAFEDFRTTLTPAKGTISVPNWAEDLNHNLSLIYNKQIAVETIHKKILAIVEELKPEVIGVVDSLKSNPMFKMLLGGKK